MIILFFLLYFVMTGSYSLCMESYYDDCQNQQEIAFDNKNKKFNLESLTDRIIEVVSIPSICAHDFCNDDVVEVDDGMSEAIRLIKKQLAGLQNILMVSSQYINNTILCDCKKYQNIEKNITINNELFLEKKRRYESPACHYKQLNHIVFVYLRTFSYLYSKKYISKEIYKNAINCLNNIEYDNEQLSNTIHYINAYG